MTRFLFCVIYAYKLDITNRKAKESKVSQEVYEMITRLDRERIETHLVVQCAPMISGMKVSNLLNVEKKLAPQMKQVLERSGISYYLLLESEDKATF